MLVYIAVNRHNQKAYVGQTKFRWTARIGNHYSVATTRNSTTPFHRALRKYGRDAFDFAVLQQCSTVEELEAAEKSWIERLGCMTPAGYNRTTGGVGCPGCEYTEERREKIRQSQLGDKNRMKNPVTARKHGDSISGDKSVWWGKFGPDHNRFGKHHTLSDETKRRQTQAFNKPESRLARSIRQRGELNVSKRADVQEKIAAGRKAYFLTPEGQEEKLRISERLRKFWADRRAEKAI